MALHFMSDKELTRLEILRDLASGRLTTPVKPVMLRDLRALGASEVPSALEATESLHTRR